MRGRPQVPQETGPQVEVTHERREEGAVTELLGHDAVSCRELVQAKGVLAQSGGLGMPDAYAALVRYARDNNLKLGHLARALVERTVPSGLVIDHADRVAGRS